MVKNKQFNKLLSVIILAMALSLLLFFFIIDVNKGSSLTSATAMSDTSVRLTWKKISSANGYVVYQKKAGDSYKEIKIIANKNTTLCDVPKLKAATKYYYKIRTFKISNGKKRFSDFSDSMNVITKPVAPILTNAAVKGNTVTLQWKKVIGVKGYAIYKITDTETTAIKTVGPKVTSVSFKGKSGTVLTARAYITVDDKQLYSNYAEERTVMQESLAEQIDYVEEILISNGITKKNSEKYVQKLRDLFRNGYIASNQLDRYFETLKSDISENIATNPTLGYNLDDVKIGFGEYVKEESHWNGKNWTALGTSITSATQGKFVEPLVELSGLKVTNHGVEGASMGGHILLKAQMENSLKTAHLITIEGAVNDYIKAVPLGKVGDTVPYYHSFSKPKWNNGGTNEGTFAGACYQVFKTVSEKAPNAVIICLTDTIGRDVPETGAHFSKDSKNSIGLTQSDYNDMMISVAKDMDIKVIDTATLSEITQENPQYYVDHIHHSEEGGKKFAETIWNELKNIPAIE